MDVVEWVAQRHQYWWDHLRDSILPEVKNRADPDIQFWASRGGTAGKANSIWCKYNLAYPTMLQRIGKMESYDETIAHEVCHVFAKRMWSPKTATESCLKGIKIPGHGELWLYLIRCVCGFRSHSKRHHMPRPSDVDLSKARKLVKVWKLEKQLQQLRVEKTRLERFGDRDPEVECAAANRGWLTAPDEPDPIRQHARLVATCESDAFEVWMRNIRNWLDERGNDLAALAATGYDEAWFREQWQDGIHWYEAAFMCDGT